MNESLKAEDIIRQYGLKLTQPRLKVLRLLLSRQEVLTADEIYEALVKEGTSLNFSTVYRTLETFTDEKITEKVQMPQSRKAGFLLFTMSHTHNLICLGCHKVIHIHGCPLHDFSEDLAKKTDFDIVGHDLTLYGYCTNCQKRKVVFIMTRKEQETLFEKCRTYRRFLQKPLPEGLLSYLVGIAHKRSCGRNGQVLSFYAAVSSKALAALLPHLHWAAALPKEIGTPQKEEEPVALIFLVRPKDASPISLIDAGIAVDSMAYCAMCEGVGSAILAALDRAAIQGILGLEKDQEVFLCLALGYPAHKSTVVPVPESGTLDYYVDEKRNYFVPKKNLSDVMTVL